jgi:hypothetical protein
VTNLIKYNLHNKIALVNNVLEDQVVEAVADLIDLLDLVDLIVLVVVVDSTDLLDQEETIDQEVIIEMRQLRNQQMKFKQFLKKK